MTHSFKDANQVRLSLKMILSEYAWFEGSSVGIEKDSYYVVVNVSQPHTKLLHKIIPKHKNGVTIKVV